MKIYTKTGDGGSTGLWGGKRLSKSHVRIETIGTIDELNAHVGLLADIATDDSRKATLRQIQDRLFVIGSMLAMESDKQKASLYTLKDADVAFLENTIDNYNLLLPELRYFILPGGHLHVSYCHIARTVCRRAERVAVELAHQEPIEQNIIIYLNRLSDMLFVLARLIGKELGIEEIKWESRDQ